MAKHFIVIDTETASKHNYVYDIGWVVSDAQGETLCERRYLVREIWENAGFMASAYYAEKLPTYYLPEIERGTLKIVPIQTIRLQLATDMLKFGVTDLYAYNSTFDSSALNRTVKFLSNGFESEFIPATYKCIWGYAQDIVGLTQSYIDYCIANDLYGDKGTPLTTAETMYRYLTKNDSFSESHTALEDARIETWMLHYLRKHHGRKKGSWKCGSRYVELRKLRDKIING